jgi:Peptidase family M23
VTKQTSGSRSGVRVRMFGGKRRMLALSVTVLCGAFWAGDHTTPASASHSGRLEAAPIAGECLIGGGFGIPRPGNRLHRGIDVMAQSGTPLQAVAAGRIKRLTPKESNPRGGNQVTLVAQNGDMYFYTHLERFADGLEAGSSVTAGQVIGFVGTTGNASIPHLHFQIHPHGGEPVDPLQALLAVDTCGGRGASNATLPPPVTTRPSAPSTTRPSGSSTTQPATPPTTRPSAPSTTRLRPTTTSAPVTTQPVRSTTSAPSTTRPRPASSSSTAVVTTQTPEPSSTVGGSDLKATVYRQRRIPADDVVGIQVVGFPGLPASRRSVEVSLIVRGAAGGRAAVWPCGERSGLDRGRPVAVSPAGATTRLVLPVGYKRRICFVSDTRTDVSVVVHSAR